MIQLHEKTLNDHAESVKLIEASTESHEKNLAKSLRDGADSDLDDSLLGRHTENTSKFAKQREAHERIKKHHHLAMAHVATLNQALAAAME